MNKFVHDKKKVSCINNMENFKKKKTSVHKNRIINNLKNEIKNNSFCVKKEMKIIKPEYAYFDLEKSNLWQRRRKNFLKDIS